MKAFTHLLTLFFFTFILGCSTPAPKKPTDELAQSELSADSPELLISKALETPNATSRSLLYFKAASLYWKNNLIAQTNAALISVDRALLSHESLQQYLLLSLKIGLLEEDRQKLEDILPLFSHQPFQESSIDQQIELASLLSKAYQLTDKPIQAAIVLIENSGLFSNEDYLNNHEIIWSELRKTELTALSQYQYFGNNADIKGWLSLAQTIKQNQISLDAQYQALLDWNSLWPNHPAAFYPPHELRILQQLPTTHPTKITLALPLSGPLAEAGQAIRDGFMASYYNTPSQLGGNIEISFFDTHIYDIETLYRQAASDNSLIIGPLDKESINNLLKLDSLSINTLALNYLDRTDSTVENLFQFGLNPESEAAQVAQRLHHKNLNKIGIIAPESNWGFRLQDAFRTAIAETNGSLVESVFYSNQASLSSTVAKLLATDESSKRAKKIQTITQTRFEFQPRRREDLDAIIMIAKPKIAKQINPLFSYHYADSIPVFSTSQVHAIENNNDLEGIEFSEIPWMLSTTIDIKNQLKSIIPASSTKYTRFYALGADAYKLAPRLTLLKEVRDSQIEGQTGTLSMNDSGRISRTMEWARFKKGKAVSIQE